MISISNKKIAILFFAISIVLSIIPICKNIYTELKQEYAIKNYYNVGPAENTMAVHQGLRSILGIYPTHIEKPSEPQIDYSKVWEAGAVMGTIHIPRINLNMPIVQGIDDSALDLGAGHIVESDYPGQIGNCVLTGHRSYTYGKLFNRLNEIEIGDEVEIGFEGVSFIYEVYHKKIIAPDDLSVLNRNEKDRVLTLITCHPIRIANKRMVLHCILRE